MPDQDTTVFLWVLVAQFWLSGLFILGVIFLPVSDIDTLTLFTFIAYALSSFVVGIVSDIYGRKRLFIFFSLGLTLAAFLLLYSYYLGLILASFCIAPLNNLSFVYINELTPKKNVVNTVKVLIGWAASQITLGIFFYWSTPSSFTPLLIFFTSLYALFAAVYTKETPSYILSRNRQPINRTWGQLLLPKEKKTLIGMSLLMFVMQMFYYRTQFTLDRFGLSLPLNTVVVGCTEVIANLLFTKYLQSVKRKLALRVMLACLSGLLLILIIFQNAVCQTVVEGVMRLVDTGIMVLLGVYLPQLFKVEDRGKGTNFVMSFGVLGSALSGKLFSKLPFPYLELFLAIALASTFLAPETKNTETAFQA